jgi:hypothetical protein
VNPLEAAAIDEPADPALLAEAVALAKDADLVIFFGGTNKSIETEGSDRQNIDLPAGQNEVVAALYEANPNLVTVLISGGPTDLRKLEPVSPAIVQGWRHRPRRGPLRRHRPVRQAPVHLPDATRGFPGLRHGQLPGSERRR